MFLPWYFILIACFQVVIFHLHFHLPNLSRKIKKLEKKQLYKKKNGFHGCQITVHSSTSNCIHIFRELFFAPQIPSAFNNGMYKKYIYVCTQTQYCTQGQISKKGLAQSGLFLKNASYASKKKAKKIIRQTQRKLEKAICSLTYSLPI